MSEQPSADDVVNEIQALLERRRTGQAKARLQQALLQNPDYIPLLQQSAWADYMDDDNAAALVTVQSVLVRDPSNENMRRLLFELRNEANDAAGAEQVIIGLLRDYPEDAQLYGRYARLCLQAMQFEKAGALAAEGRKIDPDEPGCLAAQTLCDFIENRSGATSHSLQQLLVQQPQSLRTLHLILLAMIDRGDTREAYRIGQELVRAMPENKDIAELAAELKANAHWTMLPLWPMQRWGWAASIAIWVGGIAAVQALSGPYPDVAMYLAIGIVTYAIYSWVWPPIIQRWMAR